MFSTNGIANAVVAAGPTNFGGTLYAYTSYKTNASATVEFGSDGSISGIGVATDGGVITDTISGDTWYSPNTTGIGSSYWVKATTGDFVNGSPTGSWESLSSTQAWYVDVIGDSQTMIASLFIEISSSGTGTPVVASGTVVLQAETGSAEPI